MGILRGAPLLCAALLVASPATAGRPVPGEGRILFAVDERIPLPQAPEGIAAGDIDGDGHVDLIAVADQGFTVLLGGTEGLAPPVYVPVDRPGRQPVVADLDGDGRAEVLGTTSDDPDLVVWRWQSGQLVEATRYLIGAEPGGIAAADLDDDGDPDVVIGSRVMNTVTTLRNVGQGLEVAGTFPVGPAEGNPFRPIALATADMNGDGVPDVIATDASAYARIVVLHGLGDARLAPAMSQEIPYYPFHLVPGDFDGDGDTDVATGGHGVTVLLNQGGSFTTTWFETPSTRSVEDITAGDVDGDGFMDIVALEAFYRASEGSKVVVVHGPLSDPPRERVFLSSGLALAFVLADVNGDGLNDAVVAARDAWGGPDGAVSILRNRGCGLLSATAQFPIPGADDYQYDNWRPVTALAVLEVEGRPSLLFERDGVGHLMRNDGRGWFEEPEPTGDAFPAAIEDLNADGHADILVPAGTGAWDVKLGDGAGSFAYASSVPRGGTLADMDGDGLRDLVYGLEQGEPAYRRNLGGGLFAAAEALGRIPAAARARAFAFADFDGRRGDDLALALNGPLRADTIEVWANWHGREFREPARVVVESVVEPWMGEEAPSQLEAADLDRDGRNDLILLAQTIGEQGYIATFLNGRHGEWAGVSALFAGKEPAGIVVADFDLDGAPDVAIAEVNSNDPGRTRVFRGVGDGTLEQVHAYLPGDYPIAIVAADFDMDGLTDLALSCRRLGLIGVHGNRSETPAPRHVVVPAVAGVKEGVVRVQWSLSPSLHALMQRAEIGRHWQDVGIAQVTPAGYVELADPNVQPGRRYGYRLASTDPGVIIDGSEAWVKLKPQGGIIVHELASDVGMMGDVALTIESSAEGEGTVELFDVGGRRVAMARGVRLSAGAQRVAVPATEPLGQGVYWARVRSGEDVGVGRVVVVR